MRKTCKCSCTHACLLYALPQAIQLFLRQPNEYENTAACQKAMLARESNARGLCQWSRLLAWCTRAKCSRPTSAALRLFPCSMRAIWFLVCLWWRYGDRGGCKRGGARCSDARACKRHLGPASRSAPPSRRPPLHRMLRIACDRHIQHQWRAGGGGGATALANEGLVKGLCAYASTRNSPAMRCACILGNGCARSFPSSQPLPGMRLTNFLF